MEKYLIENRLFVYNVCDINKYKKHFSNQPEQFVLFEDYQLLFPFNKIQHENGLVDIFELKNELQIQMLLLIQLNIGLIFIKTNTIVPFRVIYTNICELFKKYSTKQVLFYLYELHTSPGIVQFLHINKTGVDIAKAIEYKNPTICLPNYWEKIEDCFYMACLIENYCKDLAETEVAYWIYCMVVVDEDLPIHSVAEFISTNQHNFAKRIAYGYEGIRDLKISCAYGRSSTIQEPSRKRLTTTTSSSTTQIQKKKKTIVNMSTTCELCINKQPCEECDTPCTHKDFTACHFSIGGFHLCKDGRNIMDKEKRHDGDIQAITLKDGQKAQGFRLNNMEFICKNHKINTMSKLVHCPTIPELHNSALSISLRLYVINGQKFRFGTLKTNMRILEGDLDDITMITDSSIYPMQLHIKEIIGESEGKKVRFDMSHESKMLVIDGIETEYKRSSIRVYKTWKSVSKKFCEVVPEEVNYCISYGILDDVQKQFFKNITCIH